MLDRSCGTDASLRSEVESLLNYGQRAEPALEKPALEVLAEVLAGDISRQPTPAEKMIGVRIGQYKIVERLGAGGMGDVYRVVRADDEYQHHVALKLLRDLLREDDSSFFLTQFRNERQILANLQHPNIARLFDGGTTEDGIPYFVMELVEGQPINEYCDHQRLSIPERLRLFLQITSAVQYAHQRLIVHRDIKPANILVKADGVPVLLDFGIAKIIDPAAVAGSPATLTAMRMMTPEYACPEQIRGETITTATDVYSLGVVVYELLSGHRPYRITTKNPLEIARVICEEEPKRPSTIVAHPAPGGQGGNGERSGEPPRIEPTRLARQLRGDLDAVLLKALRKEPEQRYATAGELADDIRRYLEGRPILARRGTGMYRARKFVVRHRAGVVATAFGCVLVVAGVISILRAEHTARVEQQRAEQRFNDVRALANSLLFEIHDSIRDLPGSTPARKLLVDRALKYLDSLARESSGDAGLQRELAAAYERVGSVQGDPMYANLGDTGGAIESYRKALRIREAVAGTTNSQQQDQLALTDVLMAMGNTLVFIGDLQGALSALQEAEPIAQQLASDHKGDPLLQENYAGMCFSLARAFAETGDLARSAEYYRKSAEIRESIIGGSRQLQIDNQTKLAGSYGYLSGIESLQGNQDEAIELQTKAREILARLLATEPNNATIHGFLLQSDYWTGYYLDKKGMPAQALVHFKIALAGHQQLAGQDPKNTLALRNLGKCYMSVGIALAESGNPTAGIQSAEKGNSILEALENKDSSHEQYKLIDVAYSRAAVGEGYERLALTRRLSAADRAAAWRNARAWYVKSLDMWSLSKQKAPLGKWDEAEPDRVAKEIAKCDTRLNH